MKLIIRNTPSPWQRMKKTVLNPANLRLLPNRPQRLHPVLSRNGDSEFWGLEDWDTKAPMNLY